MNDGRRLTLVRHAKSGWRYDRLDDHARPLSRRGLRDCQRVPAIVRERIPPPDRVLTSDAARALQTCEATVAELGAGEGGVSHHRELYLASPATILAMVAEAGGDHRHLMVIGHNPGMTELYEYLSGEPLENLPTFGVAHLALPDGPWTDVAPGSATVLELLLPRSI